MLVENIVIKQQGVAAVDRALRVLKVFTVKQPIHTLASISEITGLYKSTILRICASLLNHGYLVRLGDGSYCLGPEALRLGSSYQKSFRLADVIYSALGTLVDAVSESASYHVRDGAECVCVNRVESEQPVSDNLREGVRLPLNAGATGHVFLAFDNAGGAHSRKVRSDLVAVSVGEHAPDIAAIAAPVFAPPDNRVLGVIAVRGPVTRFSDDQIERMIPAVRRTARTLTYSIGGDASKFERFPDD